MADQSITPNNDVSPEPTSEGAAKSHFSKAIEEAKAGAEALSKEARERAQTLSKEAKERAQALGSEAKQRAGAYREKAEQTSGEWQDEARAKSGEAKEMAYNYANEGKAKASEAISGLGKLVAENAAVIDEKVGAQYGDYARSAGKSMQDAASKLDEKSLDDLGEDAKEFVREKPALAVGIAAAAGFVLARLFRGR